MPVASELLTFEQFAELPEGEPGKDELLDGEWIHMPPPVQYHNNVATKLFLGLLQLSESLKSDGPTQRLGTVHIEAGYRFGKNSWLVPDVSVAHADQALGDYYEGAPLIAIEIVSKTNSAATIDRKIEKYFQNGAEEVWVFYPETRRVLTYFAGRDEVEIGREYIRSRVLPEVMNIPLATIW
jgi:Uma2 family endonuclease